MKTNKCWVKPIGKYGFLFMRHSKRLEFRTFSCGFKIKSIICNIFIQKLCWQNFIYLNFKGIPSSTICLKVIIYCIERGETTPTSFLWLVSNNCYTTTNEIYFISLLSRPGIHCFHLLSVKQHRWRQGYSTSWFRAL